MATLRVPYPVPSPSEDAEQIRKACQGWGTDEKALIVILAHRDSEHRKQIAFAYEERYNENLIKRLESELSGDFEKAVYRWLFHPIEREAVMLNIAIKQPRGIDYRVVIETACINNPDELFAAKKAYQARYRRSLEEDVASHSTGDLRKFLVSLVGTHRYNGDEIDTGLALSEARILHELVKDKMFHHEEIIRVVTTRSKSQLNATLNKYKDEFGSSFTKNLVGKNTDGLVSAVNIAIHCLMSPEKYFEKLMRSSVASKDADALTRVVVTRAEKDLEVIKNMYFKRNNVQLEHAVGKATSGDYKRFLLELIGN